MKTKSARSITKLGKMCVRDKVYRKKILFKRSSNWVGDQIKIFLNSPTNGKKEGTVGWKNFQEPKNQKYVKNQHKSTEKYVI